MKKKLKFTNCSSEENDEKKKKLMVDKVGNEKLFKKEQLKMMR